MTTLEVRKKILYFILKENNFSFSEKIFNNSIPIIQRYIEKDFQKNIPLPFPESVVKILKNEFRKLKYAFDKIKGGYQKSKLLEKITTETIEIQLNMVNFEDENQTFIENSLGNF